MTLTNIVTVTNIVLETVTTTNCGHPKVTRQQLDSRKWTDSRGINEIMKYDTGKVIAP